MKDISSSRSGTKTCFGCCFATPEYSFHCQHVLCAQCVRDFDQSKEDEVYPSLSAHYDCLLCAESTFDSWPQKMRTTPTLSGLRILTLDGGGVRGIVQLVALKRLEAATGLSLPIGAYFDLMVGTSAGRCFTLFGSRLV
jgi:Patatin-like phospholipase